MEIMKWMRENNIEILLLQETHIETNSIENKKDYTWYFSGNQTKREFYGMGIVISNKILPYVENIRPIDSHIMILNLNTIIKTTFINAYYCPHADRPEEEK